MRFYKKRRGRACSSAQWSRRQLNLNCSGEIRPLKQTAMEYGGQAGFSRKDGRLVTVYPSNPTIWPESVGTTVGLYPQILETGHAQNLIMCGGDRSDRPGSVGSTVALSPR